MSLEEHLGRAGEGGTYDSTGTFTLDREKAMQKLADFSLGNWLEILFSLGGWLARDGTQPVQFEFSSKSLVIRREQSSLTSEQVEHLEDFVLAGGSYYGVSLLALSQYVWSSQGVFVLEACGRRRTSEKGRSRLEESSLANGVRVELHLKKPGGTLDEVVEFFSRHLAWAPYRWSINEFPVAASETKPQTTLMHNLPPIAWSMPPGVVLHDKDSDFQLLCLLNGETSSVVVVDGLSYPLFTPLFEGLTVIVFCNKVQLTITRVEAVVSRSQKESWTGTIQQLFAEYFRKPHLWNTPEILGRHSRLFCRATWHQLDQGSAMSVARHLVQPVTKEPSLLMLQARLKLREGDFSGALDLLEKTIYEDFDKEEKAFSATVESEFLEHFRWASVEPEHLLELIQSARYYCSLHAHFPKLTSFLFLSLGHACRHSGNAPEAEKFFLDAFFLPHGRVFDWPLLPEGRSRLDFEKGRYPEWSTEIRGKGEDYLEGLLEIVKLAQARQSSQQDFLTYLKRTLGGTPQSMLGQWREVQWECWRLERRRSQGEWYKWLLMHTRKGWKPVFPPESHDEEYQPPTTKLPETGNARVLELRCRTVYLEYAALALRAATQLGRQQEMKRFQRVLDQAAEQFHSFQSEESLNHLSELGRIAMELGQKEHAKELLQRAIRMVPAGDYARLPLMVDLAILEPNKADSVLKGLGKVLKVSGNVVGQSLSRRVERCVWPFPLELPSRVRRLAWELRGARELYTYRTAQVLYHRAFGPPWIEPSEHDWVIDAISILS